MGNLLNYVEETSFDTFYDLAINELDILVLTELAYLPFDELIPYDFSVEKSIRLDKLAHLFYEKFQGHYPPLSMVTKERLRLMDLIAKSRRFQYLHAFGYINDYNLEQQKQFAALCFKLKPNQYLAIFRGTDDTIIGWKEDFHMAYMTEIPAQTSARNYLKKLIESLPRGMFTIAGHSKGGNLAIYAASQQDIALQNQVTTVYNFDGPGLHQSVLDSEGFSRIQSKIVSIIPQQSVIGKMFLTPQETHIVKSNVTGLKQHLLLTWTVKRRALVPVKNVSPNSMQMDLTLKTWMSSLTEKELKEFFDLIFGMLTQAGIYRFGDLTVDTLQKLRLIRQNQKNLTPAQQEMLDRMIRLLIDTRYQIWKENHPRHIAFGLHQLKEQFSREKRKKP
ncbi:DUF2974 domain-containing protein [Streptococcus sp. X16XC17]|uniref:Mbeg1-like protein n=1 Tax=unclassified Streptococcus TaxID=2608887 RepID=UPI00066FB64E|nr:MULTISPECIES: Mbeg1-like protein [unclassified Streptococcus]TCD46116.1 DUF2974 domain-containing protein [Streptococcus sp. X16XC17]